MKKMLLICVICLLTVGLTACGIKENMLDISFEQKGHEVKLDQYVTENPVVAMYIKDYGSIVLELYPDVAPNTVNNFVSLIKSGFYDNNTFHRLVPGFVLQGGDPNGMGTGGPGYTIKGEFSENGFNNNLEHTKWVVSMARGDDYDSAGSQFFIMLGTTKDLDGKYASFGKVIDGKENIEHIVKREGVSDPNSGKLTRNLTIKKVVVDLKNKEYPEVKKINQN